MAISRREFCKIATTQVAAAGLLSTGVLRLRANPLGMLIGCQTWPVREMIAKDFPGTIKQLVDAGFQNVELCSPVGYDDSGFGGLAKYKGSELKKILGDAGVTCVGICGEHGGEPRSIAFCHELGLERFLLALPGAARAARGSAGGAGRARGEGVRRCGRVRTEYEEADRAVVSSTRFPPQEHTLPIATVALEHRTRDTTSRCWASSRSSRRAGGRGDVVLSADLNRGTCLRGVLRDGPFRRLPRVSWLHPARNRLSHGRRDRTALFAAGTGPVREPRVRRRARRSCSRSGSCSGRERARAGRLRSPRRRRPPTPRRRRPRRRRRAASSGGTGGRAASGRCRR